MKKKAIIIIPTYNEKENVKKLLPILLEVFKKIPKYKMEILFVDDTSPDKTYQVIQKEQKQYSNIHLVLNRKKAGLGGAYLKGMKYAFVKLKADVVFEFDADFSHDPKKIPFFLEAIDKGADFVLGSRYIKGGSIPQNWGWHRKFLSIVGNRMIMLVLGNFKIKDWTTGYRAITKKVYDQVGKEMNNERFFGYTFQIGFLHKAVRKKFKIVEVPFHFVDRELGHSKLGPEYIKNTLLYIFKVRLIEFLNWRIFKFLVVGGIGALVQFTTLYLYRQIWIDNELLLIPFSLSVESAVIANFILSSLWTFSDRKLSYKKIPLKFFQFNLASSGSIIIQLAVAFLGKEIIGIYNLFILSLPYLDINVDTPMFFATVGILFGLFWNFFAYNKFIWKKS